MVFLDALDPRHTTGFLNDIQEGGYTCDFPCVTPSNIGGILTGVDGSKHGLVCPTRFERAALQKPVVETIIERVSKRMKVLAHGIPFTEGIRLEKGISGDGGGTGNEAVAVPALVFPQIPIDMGHVDPEKAYQSFVDHSSALFATFRQFIRNGVADAYFIGFRNLDSFTHWFQDGPWYMRLQKHLCAELKAFGATGSDVELMVFSDHGSMPARELFRINQWFVERKLLMFRAFWRKHEKRVEAQKKANPDRTPYEHQLGPHSSHVEIATKSRFINADVFDSCVDVINGDVGEEEVKEVCGGLMETGLFKGVYRREQLFPEATEEELDRLPHIIPHREPGVLVSSNLWPHLPVVGYTKHEEMLNRRTGDHWPEGYWGCTGESPDIEVSKPQDLYKVIDWFCGEGVKEEEDAAASYDEDEAEKVAQRMMELGYM